MDLKKIGILLIFVGIFLTILFLDSKFFVTALTVTVLGFFITVFGYVTDIRKQKIINDKLEKDVGSIIQPLITKYSNLNRKYCRDFEGDEYVS